MRGGKIGIEHNNFFQASDEMISVLKDRNFALKARVAELEAAANGGTPITVRPENERDTSRRLIFLPLTGQSNAS